MTPEDNLRMEAVIKRGDEYLRRALKAEARLREVRLVASKGTDGSALEAQGALSRILAICHVALAAAQPEEKP